MVRSSKPNLGDIEDQAYESLHTANFKRAISLFDKILSVDNRRKRSLIGKIEALRRSMDFRKAEIFIDTALEIYPGDPDVLCERGWIMYERYSDLQSSSNLLDSALESFDRVLRVSMTHEGALQGKIATLRSQRKFSEAEKLAIEAMGQHPKSLGIACELGWIALAIGERQKAIAAFDVALQLPQKDDSIYLWQLFLLRESDLFRADLILDEALRTFPKSVRLIAEKGWLFFYQQDFESAIEQFDAALQDSPQLPTALQGKVAALRLMGRLDEAEFQLRTHEELIETNSGLKSEKGWIAFARNDLINAERAFRGVIDMEPQKPLEKVNLAWVLIKKGDTTSQREAVMLCRQSLRITKTAEALGCLGVISFRNSNNSDAEYYFKQSIRCDPKRGHHSDLGALYIYLWRLEEAEAVLREGITIKPNEAELHHELGRLYSLNNSPEMAAPCFRRALRLRTSDTDATTELCYALIASGNSGEAEAVARAAVASAHGENRVVFLLTLANILTCQYDETGDRQLLNQALETIWLTRQIRPATAESFFQEGFIQAKLENYKSAYKAFLLCHQMDPKRIEAHVNATRLSNALKNGWRSLYLSEMKSWIVLGLICFQLGLLWYLRITYVGQDQIVDSTMITILVPICLALVIVAFLLPSLTKFSVTGVSVELAAPAMSTDPKGPTGRIELLSAIRTASQPSL